MLEYSTRIPIDPAKFKGGNEPYKGGSIEAVRINFTVRNYINTIHDIFNKYINTFNVFSKGHFKSNIDKEIFKIETESYDNTLYVYDLFGRYLGLLGKKMGDSRKTRYKFIEKQVKDFCLVEYGTDRYDIKKLNSEFHHKFSNHLCENYEYADDTVTGYLKVLDAVVRSAYEDGLIERYPFENIKYSYTEGDIKFLTKDELNKIKSKDFDDERLSMIADIFIFACHTGISHCDLYSLTKNDLAYELGKYVIKKRRSKSNVRFTVPLDKTAIEILNKYQDNPKCSSSAKLLPVPYINEYNECLKRIGDKCGISLNLTSHVARHTLATTNWINKGLSIESLKVVLGHKRIATTERYGKISDVRLHHEVDDNQNYNNEEGSLYPDKRMINQS